MTFSFSSLIRLTAFLAVGATMVAVGLSRVERPASGLRTRQSPSIININDYYLKSDGRMPHWFDVDSGRIAPMPVIVEDVIEASSRSPWVDEHGQGQVVGRWSVRSEPGPLSTSVDFGLARYTYPGGKLLDHVSTDIMPIAPPAWYPGTEARVLFASGDGRLYDFSFERNRPGSGLGTRPRPIAWGCPSPGRGEPYLSDVQWSDDPRMAGCVVATLRARMEERKGHPSYARTQVWWLKLDPAGTTIRDAGRLIDDGDDHDERSPNLTTLPDGRLVASYLRQDVGSPSWRVHLGQIRTNPARRAPEVVLDTIRPLEGQFQPSVTAFSSDGHYLAVVMGKSADTAYPTRVSTDPALFAGDGPISKSMPAPARR